jgi:hypothetical protein
MYVKVIERQVLDSILHYLDERNVDTSDVKQRQTAILNQGVIVSGGGSVVNSGAMSVGDQANSKMSRVRQQFSRSTAAGQRS